ncbi:unnamed protein product [Adineta steineri]|uniref:UDENN domain-containing protein n=1 Tax=Adineta steineri TaxID=433720 RepID=A0A818P170_9BILA|nr:unnamed protein product [Adineta steineri]CAF3615076.1 unnamed protein product [Adineta steineri]
MKSNHSNRHVNASYSFDLPSNNNNNSKQDDSISCSSLNIDTTSHLYYLPSHINKLSNHGQTLNKRLLNSIVNYKNGLIINGSLFDEQLFQPTRSSYVTDYANTPQDCNRFLEGHNRTLTCSQLDAHLYKLSFIITLSDWYIDKELLLGYYPHEDNEMKILEEISPYKHFCFPELNPKQRNGGQMLNDQSTYIFTRTLSDGHMEYGYCRRLTKDSNRITKFPIVICIVSSYSYFKLYDAILNELVKAYMSNELECNLLMQSFYSKPLPIPTVNSSGVTCILNDRRIFFYVCPRDDRLNHDYYSTLLSCLSPYQIIYLFEAMLRSKRILLFSHSPSKLTKCCLALSLLIYPFIWPYSFVSLMPSSWISDLLDSPCPFIYGCLYETKDQIPKTLDNDLLLVDLELSEIDGNIDATHFLPFNLRQTLEFSLDYLIRFRLMKSNSTLINIAVSEAFLYVFIELLHRLPDFFKRDNPLPKNDSHFSICTNYFQRHDSGIELEPIDLQQITQNEHKQQEENRLGYEFNSEEFLRLQPMSSYVLFLKEFIHGMLFLKFLDDYQRKEDLFSLFTQRLNERRQMTIDDLSINQLVRFRQTFDLLEKQIKLTPKQTNPSFSKFLKKIFE